MSNNDHFLHSDKEGTTICFSDNGNGTVKLSYQQTLDPDEELGCDTYPAAIARDKWKEYMAKGYKKATGWHTCKRRSAWHPDYYRGDE
jgi:hypothetical protein